MFYGTLFIDRGVHTMNAILNYIFTIVALTLTGVSAAFLVLLNKIKDEEKQKENNENGKTYK